MVRLLSGIDHDVENGVVQCDDATPANGRALGGGVSADGDVPSDTGPDPTVELSAPAEADDTRAEHGDQATGWIGRLEWVNDGAEDETFTVT